MIPPLLLYCFVYGLEIHFFYFFSLTLLVSQDGDTVCDGPKRKSID